MSTSMQAWRVVTEDDAAPEGPDAGVAPAVNAITWFLHGHRADGIPLCQVELCWYDELADRWVSQGNRRAFTDGGLIEQRTHGSRVALRLSDVRGAWTLHWRRTPG